MKSIIIASLLFSSLATLEVHAQATDRKKGNTPGKEDTVRMDQSDKDRSVRDGNDPTFRDDSTDASMGMSGLGSTPGTSTTSGTGGLGTNENPGNNTSSDIYNIERRDSIERAQRRDTTNQKNK